jgi:hypothetical protein
MPVGQTGSEHLCRDVWLGDCYSRFTGGFLGRNTHAIGQAGHSGGRKLEQSRIYAVGRRKWSTIRFAELGRMANGFKEDGGTTYDMNEQTAMIQ